MGRSACAGKATTASMVAASQLAKPWSVILNFRKKNTSRFWPPLTRHPSLLVARARRQSGGPLAIEGLRVEIRDRQRVFHEVLARHLAHLLGCDLSQLLQLEVDGLVRNAGHFHRPDL